MVEPAQGTPLPAESPEDFAHRLDLPFRRFSLLRRALTHRSYLNEHPEALEDNERLEFLGDAVLDFMVGAWLYNRFPEMREGQLTQLRSALVRTEQLAEFARKIDLGAGLRLGRGEGIGGGRRRQALLCGAFEALIGALYLDAGLDSVEAFIRPILEPAAEMVLAEHKDRDPKSVLQEVVQGLGYGPPRYRTISDSGPEHDKVFDVEVLVNDIVYGGGSGHSKRAAAKSAAREALRRLESEQVYVGNIPPKYNF